MKIFIILIGFVIASIAMTSIINERLLERELRECRDWERSAAPFGAWQIK